MVDDEKFGACLHALEYMDCTIEAVVEHPKVGKKTLIISRPTFNILYDCCAMTMYVRYESGVRAGNVTAITFGTLEDKPISEARIGFSIIEANLNKYNALNNQHTEDLR
jgi:hypothetical protein